MLSAYAMFYEQFYSDRESLDLILIPNWRTSLEEFTAGGVKFDPRVAEEIANWKTWIQHSAAVLRHRKFFLARGGLMGLVANEAIVGDWICIPLGCSVPIILRELIEGDPLDYNVFGEAYVHSFMFGKAIEMMEQGEIDLQEFWVY